VISDSKLLAMAAAAPRRRSHQASLCGVPEVIARSESGDITLFAKLNLGGMDDADFWAAATPQVVCDLLERLAMAESLLERWSRDPGGALLWFAEFNEQAQTVLARRRP
jgi:hypothetical protein